MPIASPLDRSDARPAAGSAIDRSRYLTDGVRLYRTVGPLASVPGMIGLEDCASLDVFGVEVDTLRRLRPVIAADLGD